MKMWLRVLFFFTLLCLVWGIGSDNMVVKGTWSVIQIQRCEEEYEYDFSVQRKKMNRTHDGFNAKITLEEDLTEDFAIRVDVCKFVDGGCKPYQKLADDSFCGFIKKYAEQNLKDALTLAGVDPPDCPIPTGTHEINDYIFNYDELPDDGIVGRFTADAFLIREGTDVGCISLTIEFTEAEDE